MSAPITGRTARIVFLAITSGAVLMTGVLVALRQPPVEGDLSLKPFSYLAPLFAAAAAGLSLTLRQRLAERRTGKGIDEWWQANFPTACLIWTAAELAILAGALSYFLAGGLVGPLTAAGGLALLLLNAPHLIEPK